jgi:hypothetical protein
MSYEDIDRAPEEKARKVRIYRGSIVQESRKEIVSSQPRCLLFFIMQDHHQHHTPRVRDGKQTLRTHRLVSE